MASFAVASVNVQAPRLTASSRYVIFNHDQRWADLDDQGMRDDLKKPDLDALAASGTRGTAGCVKDPQSWRTNKRRGFDRSML